jgi:putative nucleotidyltransferase with HDIG domain
MLRTRLVAGATAGFVLSSVTAVALTLLAYFETFVEPLRVDPSRPAPVTLRLPGHDEVGEASAPMRERIVGRGRTAMNPRQAFQVRSYERERRPPKPSRMAAQGLLYFLVFMMATSYLRRSSSARGSLLRTQVGLMGLSGAFLLAAKATLLLTDLPAEILPVAVVPLWASLLVDRRTGLMVGLMMGVCTASLLPLDPTLVISYLMTTSVATLSYTRKKQPATVLLSGLWAGLASAVTWVAAKEVFGGFDMTGELAATFRSHPVTVLISGIGSGLAAYALRPFVARTLGMVSRSQLLNLTDVEQPLLRKMAAEAPGSWEHSRAMANLAEAAAASIGADALLTRVGAYYHDLGKTIQSKYFVENLAPGERSPHESLEPEVSADAIMAHVVEGTRILREGGIPEPVVEFCYTHHGTSNIEYFWHKCLERGNPKGLSEAQFKYPGMRPRTRETAILMLIDSIEAGARTVDPPSREGFQEMVRRVLFVKMQQGQLDDSGLSIEDLRTMASQITDTLVSAYHSRIRYPWQNKKGEDSAREHSGPTANDRSNPGAAPRRD